MAMKTKAAVAGGWFRRSLPSLEPLGGYKTFPRSSRGSSFYSGTSQPTNSSHGSRTLHVRALSESNKVVSNRPLSPHLPLKKPQMSATYSISHRIFGAAVASSILLIPAAMKFSILYDI